MISMPRSVANANVSEIDVLQLLEARLWVARLGEGDVLRWWRTDGVLGPDGGFVAPRVLPVTHPTARARIVFVVAAYACRQRHPDPLARTLFYLDPETEDRLDALLVEKLGDASYWSGIMARLEAVTGQVEPAETLLASGIVTSEDIRRVEKLNLGPGGRTVAIPSTSTSAETIRLLAAGFARSNSGNLVVPYLQGA